MKKTLSLTYLSLLALVLLFSACKGDDDAIELTIQDLDLTIDENPTNGQTLGTVQVNVSNALSFSIANQTPDGALAINASTGELSVADAILFDFEKNPMLTASISADGASNTGTVTINLNDLDELSSEDFIVSIDENPTDGQSIGTVQAAGSGTLSFSITSQTPIGALEINTNTGELTVADPNLFDFETNPVITANISVTNAVNTANATVTINLNDDVNEISAQDLDVTIDENPINGQIVGVIQASSGGSLSYSISFQNPAGALAINANTGELTVADATLFDFETSPNMFAVILVENADYTVNANANISLNDINEVGEFKFGGVIFWIDPASSNSSGLVCDVENLINTSSPSSGITWGVGANTSIGASGTAIGTGQANTTTIINNYGLGSVYAAALCANSTSGGNSDWYLPSLFELLEVGSNMAVISATAQANGGSALTGLYHWTSTEVDINNARVVSTNGTNLVDFSSGKNNSGALVRAIRSWTDF